MLPDQREESAKGWHRPPGTLNCLIHCPELRHGIGPDLPPCSVPGRVTINGECPYRGQQVKYRYAIPTPEDVAESLQMLLDELS